MKKKHIYLTKSESRQLEELIKFYGEFYGDKKSSYIAELERKLKNAKIIKERQMPKETIRMNAKVVLKNLNTQELLVWRVGFPRGIDIDDKRALAFLPLGTALLGHKTGEVVSVESLIGPQKFLVEEVYYEDKSRNQ